MKLGQAFKRSLTARNFKKCPEMDTGILQIRFEKRSDCYSLRYTSIGSVAIKLCPALQIKTPPTLKRLR